VSKLNWFRSQSWLSGFVSQLVTPDRKWYLLLFLLNAQNLINCAENKDTISGFYVSGNVLTQTWRFWTLAVAKCYETTCLYSNWNF